MKKEKRIKLLERKLGYYDDLYLALMKFNHAIVFQEDETKELVFKLWINLKKARSHINIEIEGLKNGKNI